MKTRATALLVLGTLAGCGGPGAAPARNEPTAPKAPIADRAADAGAETKPEATLSSKESKVVARTLAKVAEIRGVRATRPVPGVRLKREELVGRIKEKALREYPPEALRREGQVLQLLGFAPPTFDYLAEMMRLLEAQLEGFYEPNNGTMYLASELRGVEAEATLAHELVHALQDQNWDLKSRSKYRPGHGDETMALAALAEGDATSAMFDYVMKPDKTALDMPEEMMRDLMRSSMNTGTAQSVPHILKTTLVSPYVDGLAFVHALRRKGGFEAVNRAWARPPMTTEQILHVDKWEKNEAAIAVPAPSMSALGEGWKTDDEDTFGELGLGLALGEWIDAEDARKMATGWGGDRSAMFSKGEEIALAIHVRYDDAAGKPDAYAERATSKLFPALPKTFGKPTTHSATAVCFERKDLGPLLVARRKNDIVVLAGPARATKTTWSSTSTCASVGKWADEILTQK